MKKTLLLLTVKNKPENLVLALSNGTNDYLSKPFDKKELLGEFSNLTSTRLRLSEVEHFVSLGEEIKMIMSYLKIEKTRFGEMLNNVETALGEDISFRFIIPHQK